MRTLEVDHEPNDPIERAGLDLVNPSAFLEYDGYAACNILPDAALEFGFRNADLFRFGQRGGERDTRSTPIRVLRRAA